MTRTIKHSFYITLLIALALIVGSCEEGPAGIFSSVSQETATNLTMTDALEYTSPSFVARLGTTWYAGIGTLWSKAESATTWTSLSVTGITGVSADSYPFASSGATIGSTLYVAFSDSATGNDLGVWQTTDGSTWSKTPGLPTDRYLRTLLSANGELFAVSANVRSSAEDAANYQVHRLVTGSFGADIAGGTLTTLPTSVAYDGTNYWFTAGTAIYTGSAASITALGTIPTATGAPNGDYAGVCAMGSAVVVSSRYGYLFYSADSGTTWTASAQFKSTAGSPYSFAPPTYLPLSGSETLLVGTTRMPQPDGSTPPVDGYLEFDVSGGFTALLEKNIDHDIVATANNFDTSVAGRSVGAMPLFDTGSGTYLLFAITDAYGLWSNEYNASSWEQWRRE